MRSIAVWAALAFAFVAVGLIATAVDAQTDPPASGDWTVGDTTVVEDRVVDLRGDLNVVSGGDLTLRNVTLRVFSAASPPYKGVYVQSGGRLLLTDRDDNASTVGDRTLVTRGVASWPFLFSVEQGASFEARMSAISGAGVRGQVGGVSVRADDAVLEGVTVSYGAEYSLGISSCANVTVTGCTIALSDEVGVLASAATNLTLRGCEVVGNQGDGVRLAFGREVLLDDCNVSANVLTGVRVSGSQNVTLRDCLVSSNSYGVRAFRSGHLRVEGSSVRSNAFNNIALEDMCDTVILDDCNIGHARREGVFADSVHNLTMVDCRIHDSTYDGVEVQNNSNGINVTRCTIEGNGYSGLKVENCRRVLVYGGLVRGNEYHGVWLTNCQDIEIVDATLTANGYDGLYGDLASEMVADGLNASGNDYSGVELAGNCHEVVLRDSSLSGNRKAGIWLTLARLVRLEGCALEGNEFYGLRSEGGSGDVVAVGCDVDINGQAGLSVIRNCYNVTFEEGYVGATPPTPVVVVDTGAELRILNSTVDGRVNAKGGGRCLIVSLRGGRVMSTATDAGSYVDEGWWLSVEVVWPTGEPAAGAVVNATSRTGGRNATAATGADGWARYMAVVETTDASTGVVDRNPWTVLATVGDTSNATTVSVRADATIRIVLRDIEPPVARARDVLAELGMTTVLDGTGSTDNIAVKRWIWTFDDGVGTVLLEGLTVEWTFERLGTFAGTLEVRDAAGLSSVVGFNVTVDDTLAPVVRVPLDVEVPQGTTVDLDGRATEDNDPQLLTTGRYEWTVTAAASGTLVTLLSGPLKPWTFPDMGLHVVVLRVTDQSGNWGEAAFNVTVLDTEAPALEAPGSLVVDEDVPATLAPSVLEDNDPDFPTGGRVWWVLPSEGGDVEVDGVEVAWTFPTPGEYVVEVHATDAAGNEAMLTFTVEVRDTTPPVPPVLEDMTVEMGTEVNLSAEGATDNDPTFPAGASFVWRVEGPRLRYERGGTSFAFTPPWVGAYNVTLEVLDSFGNSATAALMVTSVDTAAPQFTTFLPAPGDVAPSGTVDLLVGLSDVGTGVDVARLAVRVRLAGASEWGPWTEAGATQPDGNEVSAGVTVALSQGLNVVQLRAWDLAGNGPVVSLERAVRVNSAPVARILAPVDGASFGPYDTVVLDGTPSTDADPGDGLEFLWYSDVDGLIGEGARANATRLTPGPHSIRLEVRDGVAGHISVAQVNVTVDMPPSTRQEEVPGWVWATAMLLVAAAVLLIAREVWLRRTGGSGRPGAGGPT